MLSSLLSLVSSWLKPALTFLKNDKVLLFLALTLAAWLFKVNFETRVRWNQDKILWETKEQQYQQALIIEREQHKVVTKRKEKVNKFLEELDKETPNEEVEWGNKKLPDSVISDFDRLYADYPPNDNSRE